jgi:NTF2 fold immunity protein
MKNNYLVLLGMIFFVFTSYMCSPSLAQKQVKRDLVPDSLTAIKIAEAIWLPIYGEHIYESKPFKARSKDSTVWVVEGTLEKGFYGGVPYIEIQRSDCKILKVTHGK